MDTTTSSFWEGGMGCDRLNSNVEIRMIYQSFVNVACEVTCFHPLLVSIMFPSRSDTVIFCGLFPYGPYLVRLHHTWKADLWSAMTKNLECTSDRIDQEILSMIYQCDG